MSMNDNEARREEDDDDDSGPRSHTAGSRGVGVSTTSGERSDQNFSLRTLTLRHQRRWDSIHRAPVTVLVKRVREVRPCRAAVSCRYPRISAGARGEGGGRG
jgi:hypothetical protein